MQMPIPDDWDGESVCRWAVCWPDSVKWRAILSGLIEMPMQGRFWDFDTGNFLQLRQDFKPVYDFNFNLKGVLLMSCNDDAMVGAFNNIASAIRLLASRGQGSDCCDSATVVVNNSVQTTVVQPGSGAVVPVYGSQPPLEVAPGSFPPGYDTLEDYLLAKCQIANLIVDGVISTLRRIAAFTLFNVTALAVLIGLALASIIVFPPAAIPVMVGAIIAASLEIAVFGSAADYIEDNRDDFVCALYNGDGSASIVSVLADLIDALIATIPTTGPVSAAIKTVLLLLFNSDTLNQLFSGQANLDYPNADCSGCTVYGASVSYPELENPGIPVDDVYEIDGAVITNWGGCGDEQFTVMLDLNEGFQWDSMSLTGAVPCPDYPNTAKLYRGFASDHTTVVYDSNVAPEFPNTTPRWLLLSSVPFSLDVTVVAV